MALVGQKHRAKFSKRACLLGLLWILSLPAAFAVDLEFTTSASALFTTNSQRAAENEIDEWILSPELGARLLQSGDRLDAEAEYRIVRRLFQEDTYDDETVTTGSASLRAEIVPNVLDVSVTNHRTESTIRALASASPDNRQETTNTEVSPTLSFPISKTNQVAFQYKLNHRTSSQTESDGKGDSTILRYTHAFSKIDIVDLEIMKQKVNYENAIAPDLRSRLARIRWQRDLSRLQWSVELGKKHTQRSLGRPDKDAVIGAIEVNRQLTEDSTLTVQINRDLLDQSQMLSFGTADFGEQILVDSDLNELFEGTDAFASYSGKFAAVDYSFGYRASKQAFVDDTVQRSSVSRGFFATASYPFSRFTLFTVRIHKIRQDFTDEDVLLDRTSAGILVSHNPRRNLSITTGLLTDTSNSDSRQFLDAEFDEWRVLLRVEQKFDF